MTEEYDILVVEDEPVVVSAIRRILEPEGLRLSEAIDVDSALEKLGRTVYRLVIADLMLPLRSGHELLQEIEKSRLAVPVIVISGYASLERALQSFKLGSFDFIAKPFDNDAFLGVVHRGLTFSQSRLAAGGKAVHPCKPAAPAAPEPTRRSFCLGGHARITLAGDGTAVVNVGYTFPGMIENLDRVEFSAFDDRITMGDCCARFITSEGGINMFRAPLSGRVIASNVDLERSVLLINTHPDSSGWLFRIIPTRLEEELNHLTCCDDSSAL